VGAGTAEDPRLIVEIWLVVPGAEGLRLLMCRRVAARGGFWQGVSGRVEPSDATLREAAWRELAEELSLPRSGTLVDLGRWTEFRSVVSGTRYRKRSLALVLPSGTAPEGVRLSDEHDACRLMTFDEARAVARFPAYVAEIDALEARLRS
jgi:lipoyl(octanoyl) transferase